MENKEEKARRHANSYYSKVYKIDDIHPHGWQDLFDSYLAEFKDSNEVAAKECDDRASMPDSICNAAYRAGARDCAIFVRGSLNRTYSVVFSGK